MTSHVPPSATGFAPGAPPVSDWVELVMKLGELFVYETHGFAARHGLDVVHLRAVLFLRQANQFSNTGVALGDYLGLTKGTVSKSIALLEKKGLLQKMPDANDGRVLRLYLTPSGQDLGDGFLAHLKLASVGATLQHDEIQTLHRALTAWLSASQALNRRRTFGVCRTCRHFLRNEDGHRCGLTQESLSETQSLKICREHTPG